MIRWAWWLRFTMVALVVIGLGAAFLLMVHDWIYLYRNWWFISWLDSGR